MTGTETGIKAKSAFKEGEVIMVIDWLISDLPEKAEPEQGPSHMDRIHKQEASGSTRQGSKETSFTEAAGYSREAWEMGPTR